MYSDITEVRVFAPASLANLGCGYDVLGLAIHGPGDEIIIRKSSHKKGIHLSKISGDLGKLPTEATQNTAAVAAQAVLDHLQLDGGFEMEIHKQMPFGSGLGSSAASAVGGAFAMNELLGSPMEKEELLHASMSGEALASQAWHADNVAPCLLGGICLVTDTASLNILSLPVPDDLWITVIYDPNIEVLTAEARQIVPSMVETSTATKQAGHLGMFVSGLYESDYHKIAKATVDFIAEPQRRALIPRFSDYEQRAREAGAFAFGISGSGPSLFSFAHGEIAANAIGNAFKYENLQTFTSKVNTQGVIRLD